MEGTGRKKLFEYIKTQHGGYHRHEFTDHAYLYNLYFPPSRLISHLKNELVNLVQNYPVAQADLAGLAGHINGLPADCLVVGNGAAELIKIICRNIAGRLIIPVPSFNEYINAAPPGRAAGFPLDPVSFHLDPERFVREAVSTGADTAVIVSPNNPTSLAVPPEQIQWMADRFLTANIRLILDESFIDFSGGGKSMESQLDRHPNLSVIKSMSKCYGICGLRLGYLATRETGFLKKLRQGVHIWNINGFAEEFLRLLPGFKEEFNASCDQVINDRDSFFNDLSLIPGLNVYRPDANFIFCRLPEAAPPAGHIVKDLFLKHRILVKDCSGKNMAEGDRYLRIASRTPEENKRFIEAFAATLNPSPEAP